MLQRAAAGLIVRLRQVVAPGPLVAATRRSFAEGSGDRAPLSPEQQQKLRPDDKESQPEGPLSREDQVKEEMTNVKGPLSVEDQVKEEMTNVKKRATMQFQKWKAKDEGPAYRYRLPQGGQRDKSYDDYSGLRFPTLETAENIDYHKDRGLNRVVERAYPIQVPGYRRLDPYLREYIYFLHNLDPARFSIARIAQRYRMREKTVARVVQEWGTNLYLTRTGLTKVKDKQQTREAVIMAKKEQQYAKWVGWDQMGDEDDSETDDEALGDTKGWRSTSDWVRKQSVEVEMMSAFPMMEKRDPMPKRVDVDMVVDSRQHYKIINWIDPTDKVVF